MTSRGRRALLAAVGLALAAALGANPAASNATAPSVARARTTTGNPIVGPWQDCVGPLPCDVWSSYANSTGDTHTQLGKIALQPLVHWFGAWNSNATIADTLNRYIAQTRRGNPNVLVQMAVFRLTPWEGGACQRPPNAAEQASYKDWINRFWTVLHTTNVRAAIILQPDYPFILCEPNHSQIPAQLVRYAAQKFGSLPRVSTYIDVGAADWTYASTAANLLKAAGVQYVRGFALNATHYDNITDNVNYGGQIIHLLRPAVGDKHFVVNTAGNGRAFTAQWFRAHYPNGDFNNPPVCATRTSTSCLTLGIPPTTNVTNPALHLSASVRQLAATWCDAYLWFGRPWLRGASKTFDQNVAVQLGRTTPFQ